MKKLAIAAGILAATGIGGYVALAAFISPDRIKNTVLPTVSDVIGREVRVDGDISITLFPTFGLSLEKLVVTNPTQQTSGNLLEVEEATLAVGVLPLLKKELEVREFVLNRPHLNLVKMANGKANWEFESLGTTEAAATDQKAAEKGALPLSDIRIGTIAVKDGVINYHDRITDSKASVQKTNFDLKMPTLKETADIQGSALLNGQKVEGHIKLKTPYMLMHNEAATLKLDATSPFADIIAEANITYNTTAPRPVTTIALTQLSLAREGFSTSGTGDISMVSGSTRPEITAAFDFSFMELKSAASEAAPKAKNTAAAAAPLTWPEEPLELDGLAAADVNATLKVDQIKANGRTFGPLSAGLSLVNKRLELNLKRLGIFDGQLKATAVLNARTWPATASSNSTLENAQLAHAMPQEAGIYGASGVLNSKTELTTKGRSIKQFMENLNGNADLSLQRFGATEFDLEATANQHLGGLGPLVSKHISTETVNALKQKVTNADVATFFKDGRGQVVVQLSGPVLGQGGEGQLNMPAADISLRMNPLLKASQTRDIVLPFYIEGPLNTPAFKPDQDGITREVARQAARIGAEKLIGKALKKNDGALGAIGSFLDAATKRQAPSDPNQAQEEGTQQQPDPVKDLQKAFGGLFGK